MEQASLELIDLFCRGKERQLHEELGLVKTQGAAGFQELLCGDIFWSGFSIMQFAYHTWEPFSSYSA